MSKSSNSLDIYFHMANHYRKLNNTKSRVNSGCKKKTKIIDETEMKQNKKGNLNIESHGKVIQRTGRPKTRRNLSDMPPQMITKARAQSNKSNVSKGRTSSVTRKTRRKSGRSTSGSQSSRNSSNSSNHAAGDTRNTSIERSTTHGVESIMKDSVTEHEYLQFALRITEDIIKNDLYNCDEMKRVFNSHIEANRGRLELNKMREQVRSLAKELNVKFDESEIYTLGPMEMCKNPTCIQTDHTRCELIYVAKDMDDFDESKSAHSNDNETHFVKTDGISEKENVPVQHEKNKTICCKSMNTLPENKNNCDACTNTKVVVLKNTLIRGEPITPNTSEDHDVQINSDLLKIVDKKSAACCPALEKIWVVDVATSMSHQKTADTNDKIESETLLKIGKTQDSDSSINSAEKLMESLENETPERQEIKSLITKDIIPAIQAPSPEVKEKSAKFQLDFDEPNFRHLMENSNDMICQGPKILSSSLRFVYHKPLVIEQDYLLTTSSHFSNPTNTEYENENETEVTPQSTTLKRQCTCGCCQKTEHPSNITTIWDDLGNDVYNYPEAIEKKSFQKNDTENKPGEYYTTISPTVPKIIRNEPHVFENIQPEKEKKKCLCGKRNCALYCKSDDYAIFLPEMLAKFFPSVATQITPSDLLLINIKSESTQSINGSDEMHVPVEHDPDDHDGFHITHSSDSVHLPNKPNLYLSELSPLHSMSHTEKDKQKEYSFDHIKVETPSIEKKIKGRVRTSVSEEPVTEYPIPSRHAASASDNVTFEEMALSASETLQNAETSSPEAHRDRSMSYEKRKSSFTPTKYFENDEDNEIPIIIPDRKEQRAFKEEQNIRGKDFNRDAVTSGYDIEMKSDVKSVADGDLGTEIEDFMNQLDLKPNVTKTNSFDKQIKKTIQDGEMFRHPENRRIGFESNSGIDLNRTSITEEDQQRTLDYENDTIEENGEVIEEMKEKANNENKKREKE